MLAGYFTQFSSLSFVDFEQVNVDWVIQSTGNENLNLMVKDLNKCVLTFLIFPILSTLLQVLSSMIVFHWIPFNTLLFFLIYHVLDFLI